MGWETDEVITKPCDCGAGTIEITRRSNDWCQHEEWRSVECPVCRAARDAVRRRRAELKATIQALAEQRYLDAWLKKFKGLNKREIWSRITNKYGYPSLGTFYKHTKSEGLDRYLRRNFFDDVEQSLAILGESDEQISMALAELDSLPNYDSRQQRLPH